MAKTWENLWWHLYEVEEQEKGVLNDLMYELYCKNAINTSIWTDRIGKLWAKFSDLDLDH